MVNSVAKASFMKFCFIILKFLGIGLFVINSIIFLTCKCSNCAAMIVYNAHKFACTMFINDEKIGDVAVEVVGQIHVAVKRDYCFFFNFKSILHKKHTILCSTEYLLHKKLHFFINITL